MDPALVAWWHELAEEVLKLSVALVVRHEPHADPPVRIHARNDNTTQLRIVRDSHPGSTQGVLHPMPSVVHISIRVSHDAQTFIGLSGHTEGRDEGVETSTAMHMGKKNAGVIPIDAVSLC